MVRKLYLAYFQLHNGEPLSRAFYFNNIQASLADFSRPRFSRAAAPRNV
jgi:hypothetical protein